MADEHDQTANFEEFLNEKPAVEFDEDQQARLDFEISKERDKGRKKNAEVRALRRELHEAEERFQFMAGLKDPNARPFIPKIAYKGTPTSLQYPSGEAVLVFVASDWHIEERVDAKTVNDRNEYNPDIAWRRSRKFFESCLWLLGKERKGAEIDTMIFGILGDMITGYIHEELREANYLSPVEATLMAHEMLVEGINRFLNEGDLKELIIPCCHGNHGRVNPKKTISTSAANSYEWMMYHHLRKHFEGEDRVKFIIADGYHIYVHVFESKKHPELTTTIRFHHGDSVQYGGGVGGITIPLRKAIAQWNKNIPADLDVLGHFHQMTDGGEFVTNGSLIGWNAYALSIKAGFERPRQVGFLVRPGRGKVQTFEVFVD